ncbi:MAG: response regulator [Gammaproteobacteria bacterium]|nr:response regulator [Gammaproteobacteria bacterium]
MSRILLVDDEPMILRIMRVTLEDRGFQIKIAHNGLQALELVGDFEPHAVVTDIDMPKMNGRELCQKLRERYSAEDLPLFVVTSKTAVEHRAWSEQLENLHFLEKPVSLRKLCTRLEMVLQEGRLAQECTT